MNPEYNAVPPPVIQQPNVAPPIKPRLPKRGHYVAPGMDILEQGEEVATIVRRHPIGIVGFYIEGLIGVLLVSGFAYWMGDILSGEKNGGIIIASTIIAVAFLVFFLFVATYVYRQCRILVTDRSLVQVMQKSLFIRKVSRLSLSNVEDVSAESRGILASIFGYGTLMIQTAGALENFEFSHCPNPSFYADQIIEARQRYALSLQESENEAAERAVRNQ